MSEPKKRIMAPKEAVRPMHEAHNRVWHAVAPAEHTLKDALCPTYLRSRLKDMRAGDTFEIRHERHAFVLKGYIVEVDRDAETIAYHPIEVIDLSMIEAVVFDWAEVEIVEQGQHGWCIRDRDRILKKGFPTEDLARKWVEAKRELALRGKVATP